MPRRRNGPARLFVVSDSETYPEGHERAGEPVRRSRRSRSRARRRFEAAGDWGDPFPLKAAAAAAIMSGARKVQALPFPDRSASNSSCSPTSARHRSPANQPSTSLIYSVAVSLA